MSNKKSFPTYLLALTISLSLALSNVSTVKAQGGGGGGFQEIIRDLRSSSGARVSVEVDRASQSALEFRRATTTVPGYRICLFSGTDQNARARANEAISRMKEMYPHIESKWIYDAPVFRVHTGAWVTRIEATMMLAKLKDAFPAAFIIGDKVALNELLTKPSEIVDPTQITKPSEIIDRNEITNVDIRE